MYINITIFVQIINFVITYKILKTVLFKPVINSLEDKKEKTTRLENKNKENEAILIDLEKKKINNIVVFQKHAKTAYPFIPILGYEKQLKVIDVKETQIDAKLLNKKIVDLIVLKSSIVTTD
jgi:hypothetical protein